MALEIMTKYDICLAFSIKQLLYLWGGVIRNHISHLLITMIVRQ